MIPVVFVHFHAVSCVYFCAFLVILPIVCADARPLRRGAVRLQEVPHRHARPLPHTRQPGTTTTTLPSLSLSPLTRCDAP